MMETKNKVALNILQWLGGSKFLAMTGSKNLIYDNNSLNMNLVKNISKANNLRIEINDNDLYDVKFTKFTAPRLNKKNWTFTEGKTEVIHFSKNVFGSELQKVFKLVTGLDTNL